MMNKAKANKKYDIYKYLAVGKVVQVRGYLFL